jgi:FMN phosphatase YigB (HAD superfamily)
VRLGVVTNTEIATKEKLSWFRLVGIDKVWDAFATSSELGAMKPDPRIYQAALEPLGLPPREAAFVGHAAVELDGAKALGMRTIAFNRDDETVTADFIIDRFEELLGVVRDLS